MKGAIILLIFLLSGCIGVEPINETGPVERNLSKILLSTEDLGPGSWVQSAENISADVYERRFVRVEGSFGGVSRLVNRVHLYSSNETAIADYQAVAQHLKDELPTKSPQIGEESVLWIVDSEGYMLFKRGGLLVELEYTSSGTAEPEFLIGLAQRVDSKIKG